MRIFRWVALLTVLVAVPAAAAACSGGGTSGTTETPAPAGSATATQASSDGGGGDSGSSDDVTAVKQKYAASTFKASYRLTGGGDGAFSDGTMVIYKDGDKRFRFDVTATQDGKNISIVFLEREDLMAFCLSDPGDLGLLGVPSGQGVCFKSDRSDQNNPASGLSSTFSVLENADFTVLETSTRTVAGIDATCFRAKDNPTGAISTACFAKDGVLLYVKNEGADTSEIEATDVSGAVSADDFNPPFELRDFPAQ